MNYKANKVKLAGFPFLLLLISVSSWAIGSAMAADVSGADKSHHFENPSASSVRKNMVGSYFQISNDQTYVTRATIVPESSSNSWLGIFGPVSFRISIQKFDMSERELSINQFICSLDKDASQDAVPLQSQLNAQLVASFECEDAAYVDMFKMKRLGTKSNISIFKDSAGSTLFIQKTEDMTRQFGDRFDKFSRMVGGFPEEYNMKSPEIRQSDIVLW